MAVLLDLLDMHDDSAVEDAIRAAGAVLDDPVDSAGAALLTLLHRVGVADVDQGSNETWARLTAGEKAALLLHEVEQIPLARAALLLFVSPPQLEQAYRNACDKLDWEPLGKVGCAGWATVARLHRVATDHGEVGLTHLEHCPRCAIWHFERQDRRAELAAMAPWIGATGLGYLWDPASI